MSRLFLFTLTWNGLPMLEELYRSLMPALKDVSYSWHIKDNGSVDGTVEAVRSWAEPNITVHAYPDNKLNFAEGMNWLYAAAKPQPDDYVMLLNNDVVIRDVDSIQNMMAEMKSDVGVVGARLLYTDTNRIQHGGVIFSERHGRMPIHFRANEESDADAEQIQTFQAVTGAVLLTKAKYYQSVASNPSGRFGMDERYRWAFEDIDLCLAVSQQHNKKVVYCGKTNIFHGESVSLKKNPVNKLFINPNVNLFKSKWTNKYVMDGDLYNRNHLYGKV